MDTKRIFLSYAHIDRRVKSSLVAQLTPHLQILRGVRVQWWEDEFLTIGEGWVERIHAELDASDYGLLLLSPGFFTSDFISRHELPRFVGRVAAKGALPVGLKPVALDGAQELSGVERLQIFTARDGSRFFSQTAGAQRERFVLDLAIAIRDRLVADAR